MGDLKMRVRELAGWGLDENEFRPLDYRGSLENAHVLVAKRKPFENRSALVESSDCQELLQKHAFRDDLRREISGLDWSLGVVDLRLLLAFQRRLTFNSEVQELAVPASDDWEALVAMCFAEAKPVACDAVRTDTSVLFHSANPNLQFRVTGDTSNPVMIHFGSPFFEVGEYQGRWFLRDGYHRAFRALQSGVFYLPAVIVRTRTLEELGAAQPWFFSEAVLFSEAPPHVLDFLDEELVIQYDRSPLIKTLRITLEETYSLQGEK